MGKSVYRERCDGRDPDIGEAVVYVLQDPESRVPFYVGSTTRPLWKRLITHQERGTGIPYLVAIDYVPILDRFQAEQSLIDELRARGYPLRNQNRAYGKRPRRSD